MLMGARGEPRAEATAYLSLGSNLGERRANLEGALKCLRETPGVRIERVSGVYRSAPIGVREQPEFLNLAVEARTALAPSELLRAVKDIERTVGRTPGARWGPRVIDIDILIYDGVTMETKELTLPHPRLAERAFVVVPLAEIAPDLMLPDGRRARDVAIALAQEQDVNADV
jgi:2-amino-4-hydroxy-6-hydroxymethyldihydropteridine diphosphokinase